jgi:DNA-binding CsgD family transcriptional regulator
VGEQHIAMRRNQYEAVKLIARGLSYEEVGRDLGISDKEVGARLQACRKQFYCKTLAQLFFRLGIAVGRNLPVRFLREEEQARD